MYRRSDVKKMNFGRWSKTMTLMVSLILVIGVTIGGTLAYLMDKAGPVVNKFTPSKVTTTVEEELNNGVKTNVKIQNTGDTEAYIRAAVVVTWKDADGNVYGKLPEAKSDADDTEYDYVISYQTGLNEKGIGWVLGPDGFYYWTAPVAPKADFSETDSSDNYSTGILFTDCKVAENANVPTGYALTVEIIGSGIQSLPTSVVTTEWSSGVSGVSGNILTIKTAN